MREEDVRAVLDALGAEMRSTAAVVRLAALGLRDVADQTRAVPVTPENPDPLVMVGPNDPNVPGNVPSGQLRRSELLQYAQPGGAGAAMLEQWWMVSMYSRWENHYRQLIGTTADVARDDVGCVLFGDLRHRRNDIIHHDGKATARWSAKTVLLPAIAVGEVVRMTDDDFVLASTRLEVTISQR